MSDQQIDDANDVLVAHQSSHPRRRRWTWVAVVLAALFLLSAPLIVRWIKNNEVERRLAAIRARGEPTSYAEFWQMHEPLMDREATEQWLSAVRAIEKSRSWPGVSKLPVPILHPLTVGWLSLPSPRVHWPERVITDRFLAAHEAELESLRAAAASGGRSRYADGPYYQRDVNYRWMEDLRRASLCLCLEASARAHAHDGDEAIRSILAVLSLADSMADEPTLTSQTARVTIHNDALCLAQTMLPVIDPSDTELLRLQERFRTTDFREAIRRGQIGERARGLDIFNDIARSQSPNKLGALGEATLPFDQIAYLDYMDEAIAAASQPWPAALLDSRRAQQTFFSSSHSLHPVAAEISGYVGVVMEQAARAVAGSRIVAIGAATELYRRRHGAPPAKLDDLAPEFLAEIPSDPFNGNPFHYESTGSNYVIYSDGRLSDSSAIDPLTGADQRLLYRWSASAAENEAKP